MQRSVFAACAASIMLFGLVSHADAGGKIIAHKTFDLNTTAGNCKKLGPEAIISGSVDNPPICAITGISGHFDGGGEFGSVTKNDLGTWSFQGQACQPGVTFTVTCFQ